jgi:hypothetical protein
LYLTLESLKKSYLLNCSSESSGSRTYELVMTHRLLLYSCAYVWCDVNSAYTMFVCIATVGAKANTPPITRRLRPHFARMLNPQNPLEQVEGTYRTEACSTPFAHTRQDENPAEVYGPPAPSPPGRPMCDSTHRDGPRVDRCDKDRVCNKVYRNDCL